MSRKMFYLNNNKIVYRRDPISDKPTEVYEWGYFYEHGTYECYTLFRSKAQITTYKSLKWHLIVLLYLNEEMTHLQFDTLARFIADKKNGYVTFNCPKNIIDKIIDEINLIDFESDRPKNKPKKVIFRDNSELDTKQKQQIIGKLIGKQKKATPEDIYEAMLTINDDKQKITIKKIATILNVSTRTIYRNISNGLVREKILLNEKI